MIMGFLVIGVPQATGQVDSEGTTPLYPMQYAQDTFKPKVMNDMAYYSTGPTTHYSDVRYQGLPTDMSRSSIVSNMYGYSSATYTNLDFLSTFFTIADTHNPTDVSPNDRMKQGKIVRIANADSTTKFTTRQQVPISLIDDHSVTYVHEGETQFLTDNNTQFLILDISSREMSASVDLYAPDFGYYNYNLPCSSVSIPLFNTNSSQTNQLPIAINSNYDTPITVTPHYVDASFFSKPIVMEGNTTNALNIDQGEYARTVPKEQDDHVFDVNIYNVTMEAGHSYKMDLTEYNLLPAAYLSDRGQCSTSYLFADIDQHYEEGVGMDYESYYDPILDTNLVTPNQDLSFQAFYVTIGAMHKNVNFFLQEYTKDRRQMTTYPQLILNQDNRIIESQYYQFTLNQDSLFGLNASTSDYFSIYQWEDQQRTYITSRYTKSSPLYGDYFGQLSASSFILLQAGTYQIRSTNTNSMMYGFTSIPITELGNSKTETFSKLQPKAFSYQGQLHAFNMLNLTQAGVQDIAVDYEYMIYNPNYGTTTDYTLNEFGNASTTVSSVNQTTIENYYGYTNWYDQKIFMLLPYSAQNSTQSLDSFSTQVQVSLTTLTDNIVDPPLDSYNYQIQSQRGDGAYTFGINSADHGSTSQILVERPLNLEANQLYNISIQIFGNYTNTNYNGSVNTVLMMTDNLLNSLIFGDEILSPNGANYTGLFYTQSTVSNLHIVFDRAFSGQYLNFSVSVSVKSMNIPQLSFDMPTFTYDGNVTDYYTSHPQLLFTFAGGPAAGSSRGGFLGSPSTGFIVFSSLFVTAVIIRRKRT